MDEALRAGIAAFNAGHHHAAHDAWEDVWLSLPRGSTDERFLHGLIQYTAAVYHARRRNWSGATGLAESAVEYLSAVDDDYRGVNVAAVCAYLRRLRADPEFVERARPFPLRYEGRTLALEDLGFDAAAVAAELLADDGGYDGETVARAVELAREELDGGTRTRFVGLVSSFVADEANRPVIYDRLRAHVEKRDRKRRDVDGLFE